jgi:parvulin-like peptidyl-prolyl isomerase
MRIRSLAALLLCSLAVGQATSPSAAKPGAKAPSAPTASQSSSADKSSAVAPDAAVITIQGICDTPAPKGAAASAQSKSACKTVVTRAQFEQLASALQPNMNPAMKRRLADLYPKMLVMAHEARKRGLENDPKYKQVLQFAKLQILSQELSRSLKDESEKISDAEIEKYYKDNASAFEEADMKRLFIPKEKQSESGDAEGEDSDQAAAQPKNAEKADPGKAAADQKSADQTKVDQEAKKKADEDALKKEAETLHTRAAAGEDFDKLQKEAFEAASIKGNPPSTAVGKLTPNEVPVTQRAVLDLKPGQVSDIITEQNGYYIYKLIAKDTKPLAQARDQIRATLAQQKMQDTVQKIQDSAKTDLNQNYFAAAAPAGVPTGMAPPSGAHGGMPMSAQPGAPAASASTPGKAADSGQTPPSTSAPPPKN